MAELASGAVSSLLGLLRNEQLLLSRVGSDVEFIKEEMESMHSFLEHLARTAPPAGGHDEQVGTWMKQVRDLAHDCSNCIDLYLRRGDPAVYRARAGRWRYLWWASWLVQRMVAQHNAAIRLGELKERARDVGNRRLRYGVDIPREEAGGSTAAPSVPPSSQQAASAVAAAEDDDDEDEDRNQVAPAAAYGSDPRQRALEPPVLEEYCTEKLANWLELQAKTDKDVSMTSIAIVAPRDTENADAIAHESLTWAATKFTCNVWINLSVLHLPWDLPLLTSEILSYILRACEQQQGTLEGEVWERDPREQAYRYKDDLEDEILGMIDDGEIDEKMEQIKSKIGEVDEGKIGGVDRKKVEETKSLVVLLHALRLLQEMPDRGLPLSVEDAMVETASKLKIHMEAGDESMRQICLVDTQYRDILKKAFPAQEADTSATTLGEDRIKEIIHNHKITLDIIWKLLPKQQLLQGHSATGVQEHGGHYQVANSAAAAAAASTKESIEKMEISGEVQTSSAIAAAASTKESDEKMKISEEVQTSTAIAAIVKETNEKMKQISGEVKARSAIAATINETKDKMDEISEEIQDKLVIKGIVDKIKPHLENKKTLIILQDDEDYVSTKDYEDDVSPWEATRNALNLLGCASGSAVIVSTKNSQKAKEFCCPPAGEPIICSLVGLYHDIVLQHTQQRMNNGNDGYNPKILRDILDRCHPHEFCIKIFAHALYANPNRSYEELQRLHEDLVPQKKLGSNAKKMLKFSYKDLPREYKTCLLYLAIFPQGHNIRRSTLIGRWVTEGLITKQDWRTAVRHAKRCFDALIKRGLVLARDIGAAGKVKSCMVGDEVHGFITRIANKEHILDARLSDLWARHFSIFSGLRLRASDGIDKFVHKLPKYSPQLPLLKVLDLEGANCFDKNHYLKDICKKILLLKYLSLRGTNVKYLPSEINNLHELEVLDIRQTMVPENATRDVLLLKLRRLLADRVDPGSRTNVKVLRSAVQIPCKIVKMENLEVLSNVKASRDGRELKDIRNLWQLRKLGVVIEDRDKHVSNLVRTISDLKECLQSLSITISKTKTKSTPSSKEKQSKDMPYLSRQTPKHLESLSINGVTQRMQLLGWLAKGSDELAKVTLSGTLLNQENLMFLAVLPKLHCLRLRSNAYNGSKLTFKKDEFPHLKYFLVEGTNMTDIKFEDGATAELEKIVLSFTNIRFLCGIGDLPKLKELELEGNQFLLSFSQDGVSPQENADSSALERDSKSRASEEITQSRLPEKNAESRAPEQNTESRAAGENTKSRAPEQNAESRAAEQSTQSKAPEQNTQSRAAEQNMESRFIFKKEKFQHLKYFHVENSKMTNIIFENEAAPELKKITLSLTNKQSQLAGVGDLPKLKEIELKGEKFLLSLFDSAHKIAKLTLRDTQLKQDDIQMLATKPNLHCLVLSDKSYDDSQLTFNKDEFPKLNLLIVECPNINSISFTNGSAPNLEKIVWSFTEMKCLSGIGYLLKLKEIECGGDLVPYQVRKDTASHRGQPVLTHKKPQQHDQGKETSIEEEDDDTRFPPISCGFLKNKNRR